MARTRVRTSSLSALTLTLALVTGCGGDSETSAAGHSRAGKPAVVATTTWQGAIAQAAGADNIEVIVDRSVPHAPDYDPKPSDLITVAQADFVLYASFEPYAAKIKEAAGSKAKQVEVNLDNDPAQLKAEVTRLAGLFGTEKAAERWNREFDTEYARLNKGLRAAWPGGKSPLVVSHAFTTWAARLAGATTAGTYGPEAVTPAQLARLTATKPALVLDNAHMSTGTVLPDTRAKHLSIVNYPGDDLDLLPVYRNAATELKKAMTNP
ncbi:zinc ABC transporter substrate-binding protein [Streptomyces sp. NPDC000594]|uniref:metal ABC transporter solute-binding protein, Zn/Mn family n=1 Tax=Streptomyces sp. NPDC000594 TaxID=3154261 RepID=UPI003329C45D